MPKLTERVKGVFKVEDKYVEQDLSKDFEFNEGEQKTAKKAMSQWLNLMEEEVFLKSKGKRSLFDGHLYLFNNCPAYYISIKDLEVLPNNLILEKGGRYDKSPFILNKDLDFEQFNTILMEIDQLGIDEVYALTQERNQKLLNDKIIELDTETSAIKELMLLGKLDITSDLNPGNDSYSSLTHAVSRKIKVLEKELKTQKAFVERNLRLGK